MNARRKFIKNTSLFITALPFLGIISCDKKRKYSKCATTEDVLGPYYREFAPERENLIIGNQAGDKLLISGLVLGVDCETPINNAKIEIWHANHAGVYDNDTNEFEFRATTNSDENGNYSFSTIKPGKYLNGNLYRPSHIHLRITHKDHKELVTQIYFKGDSDIENDKWASTKDAEDRILTLSKNANQDLTGIFNIILAPN